MTPGTPVSLGNGFAISSRFLIIVGFPDETSESDTPLTRIFYLNLDGKTLFTYQEWPGETVVSACLRRPTESRTRAGCFLSDNGRIQILNSNEHIKENLNVDPNNFGSMRSIQEIGETLYACGFGGQVYRRWNTGWEAIDGGLEDQSKRTMREELGIGEFANQPILDIEKQLELSKQRPNFTKIDGLSESDAYLTGLNGTIMHYNGSMLSRLSSPTDVHLLDIHCVNPDRILMVGYSQTLLIGSATGGFSVAHESDDPLTFYSVREFRNEIYFGTTAGLRRFTGSGFEVVHEPSSGLDASTVIQQIDSVDDECLWIVGDRHICRYDGVNFKKIELVDNKGL
ncbi:hypothetical protein [Agrobacterium rubi]|uniref:hypothetical protein n=1 Tax=Agrobacterium rubi TaxID=28099 RepID=UPI000A48DD39|nr:hypothetical protein [Agrobacterium rubi]MBP1881655.1 hypothetical protein [Agrobacterium rubi]